jgi:WASH complex subunit strumpellin
MKIMDRLKYTVKALSKVCEEEAAKRVLQSAYTSLKNMGSFGDRYENTLNALKRTCKNLSDYLVGALAEIGQYVMLRDMICLVLRMLGKTGSPRLCLVLSDLNEALLNDCTKNQFVPET